MPPRTAEERVTHARRAAALYQAATPQASPQRSSPRSQVGGGGGKESGGELDALYARAMALSKEKEQQFRASVGRSSRALVGDGGATEGRMPPATALPPPTLPGHRGTPPSREGRGAHAASYHAAASPRRPAAASAAAGAASAATSSSAAATATVHARGAAAAAGPSSDESSAVELVNTMALTLALTLALALTLTLTLTPTRSTLSCSPRCRWSRWAAAGSSPS